jgi:hypothetical protein
MQPHFQFILPTSSSSFQWLPELQHHAPGVPIVLAGTKLGELYDNEGMFPFICIFVCHIMSLVGRGMHNLHLVP